MFIDRIDAGRQLAEKLQPYQGRNPLVLAIPLGGVPVGFEVAKLIQGEFFVIMVRRLPFPNDVSSSFGAIAEDGSMFILPGAASDLNPEQIKNIVENQRRELRSWVKIFRGGQPLPDMRGKNVILVNDGIAMGPKIYVAINLCQKQRPERIIIGAPVCSPEVGRSLEQMNNVSNTVLLEQPKYFRSVSQVYEKWHNVTEYEVISFIKRWKKAFA